MANNVKEIQKNIEKSYSADFVLRNVPELFYLYLGLEYCGVLV